jgi:hypothetical protein
MKFWITEVRAHSRSRSGHQDRDQKKNFSRTRTGTEKKKLPGPGPNKNSYRDQKKLVPHISTQKSQKRFLNGSETRAATFSAFTQDDDYGHRNRHLYCHLPQFTGVNWSFDSDRITTVFCRIIYG